MIYLISVETNILILKIDILQNHFAKNFFFKKMSPIKLKCIKRSFITKL